MLSCCLASTENYTPLGFRGRRFAVSGGLPAARLTADPASAAESEQASFSFSFDFCCLRAHGPCIYRCRALPINVVDTYAIYVVSIQRRSLSNLVPQSLLAQWAGLLSSHRRKKFLAYWGETSLKFFIQQCALASLTPIHRTNCDSRQSGLQAVI